MFLLAYWLNQDLREDIPEIDFLQCTFQNKAQLAVCNLNNIGPDCTLEFVLGNTDTVLTKFLETVTKVVGVKWYL